MTITPEIDAIVAVDLGGTKLAVALFTSQGRILQRLEEPTLQLGPQPGIQQIVRLVQAALDQAGLGSDGVLGVGVGIPAVLRSDDDFVIWAPNLEGWRDVALQPALEAGLGLPVFIEYDGHAAVLGEWWQGAGQGYRSVAMLIVGTGIGGGMILDGQLFRGRDRLAGAAGWFALTTDSDLEDPAGLSRGHWESLCAGPGIANRAISRLAMFPESSLNRLETITAKQIFEEARAGDPFARQIVHETACLLGLGIANIVSLVDPEIVILGGSVGRQGDLLLPRIQEVVLRWAQPASARSVVITTSTLATDAGLYGAAYAALTRARPTRFEQTGGG